MYARGQVLKYLLLVSMNICKTPYAKAKVPGWFDKLKDVIQNQEEPHSEHVQSDSTNTREEWMIISHTI